MTPKPAEITGNRKKRKVDLSPATEEAKSHDNYSALLSKIRELASLVTKNTTIPIKDAIDDLSRRAARLEATDDLRRRTATLELDGTQAASNQHTVARVPPKVDGSTQTISVETGTRTASSPQTAAPVNPKVDSSTQTIPVEELDEEYRAMDLQRRIQEATTAQNTEDLVKEDWPPNTFRRTTIEQRSVLAEDPVLAVLVKEDTDEDDELIQQLVTRFPAVAQLTAPGGLQAGEVAAVATQARVSIRGRKASNCQKPQVLVFGKVRGPGSVTESIQTTEKLIEEIAEAHKELKAPPPTKVAFHFPMSWNQTMLRKAVECHYTRSSTEALICLRGNMGERYRTRGDTTEHTATGPRTVQVTVRGETYVNMLKKLKGTTNPGELGCLVKGCTKTQKGELRLQIEELKPGGSQNFVEYIGTSTQLQVEAKRGGPEVSYLIRDLDETSTVEEIRRALATTLKGVENEFKIGEPRESNSGRWSATVRLPRYYATGLKNLNRIKIGWLTCRIGETLGPQFCFNCLKTDHRAKDCKQPRVEGGRCFRCGEGGHAARDCKAAEKCFTCKAEGHIANTMACPIYKEHIAALRTTKPQPAEKPATGVSRVKRRKQRRAQEVQEFDTEDGPVGTTLAKEPGATRTDQETVHARQEHPHNDDESAAMQH